MSGFHLDVKDVDGRVANWMVEGGPSNVLLRRGFTTKILPEGSEIVVDGYQSKDGALRANGRDIAFADGKKLFVGSSAPVRIERTAVEITIAYLVSCFRRR